MVTFKSSIQQVKVSTTNAVVTFINCKLSLRTLMVILMQLHFPSAKEIFELLCGFLSVPLTALLCGLSDSNRLVTLFVPR